MNDKIIDRETNIFEKEVLVEKYKTALKKTQFINDLKHGLGVEIKNNPGKARIIKKPFSVRLINWLQRIFNKF
jgi:hypothetical protein